VKIVRNAIDKPMKSQDGVKVTDLMFCPRRRIFEIVNPMKKSSQNVIRTAAGSGLHRVIQKGIIDSDPERYETEMPVEYKGLVFGSIDLYDKQFATVIDIKEKLVNGSWAIRPFSSHEEQLKNLMAMKNTSKGVLLIVVVNGKGEIKQFNYHMNLEERRAQLIKLEEKAKSFLNAKNEKNPYLAFHVFFDKNLNWLCHKTDKGTGNEILCPYYWDCSDMIKREREKRSIDREFTEKEQE
jgi:hypothetical protein